MSEQRAEYSIEGFDEELDTEQVESFSYSQEGFEVDVPVEQQQEDAVVQTDIDPYSQETIDEEIPNAMTEDDWLKDASFIQDARTLANHLPIIEKSIGGSEYLADQQGHDAMFKPTLSIEEMQAGMAAATEAYVHQDADYAKGAMEAIGQIQWNLKDLGLTAMGVSEWPEEAQMALIRSMKRYDEMPTELRHIGRAIGGVATDPTTYLGFGAFASAMGKVVLKGAATKLLQKLVATPTGIAALEGSVYAGGEDILRQGIDNKGDFSKNDAGQTAAATAFGYGVGGTIGFTLNKFFGSSPSKKANDEVTDEPVSVTDEVPEELSDQADALGLEAPTPRESVDDVEATLDTDAVEGELLDDNGTLPVKSDTKPEDEFLDGETDSYNNPRDMDSDVGEDYDNLYNGKKFLNTDRLETIDDVKGLLESGASQTAKKRLGPPETLDESRRLADEEGIRFKEETGGDISKILGQFKDDAGELKRIRGRAQKLRELNVSLGERIIELADKHGKQLTYAEAAELMEKAALFANTMEMGGLISREFGRGLGNYRLIMKGDPMLMEGLVTGTASADVNALVKTIKAMTQAGKGKNAKGGLDLKDLKGALSSSMWKDATNEVIRFRSAMMLSGPSTIEAAALSNITRLWTEPFWEWAGNMGAGSVKKAARLRATAQWAGNKRYAAESWKLAVRAYKNGQHISDPFVTKVEGQSDKSLNNMSSLRRNVWERGVHQAHLMLLFLDEGVKAQRSRSIIYADTVVEAAKRGIDSDAKFEQLLNKNLRKKIDSNGRITDKEVLKEVRETTFTADLEGNVGDLANIVANGFGGWGRLIAVPFIRAPINIVSEGLMYIPGSKLFSQKQQRIDREGTLAEKARLKARRYLGAASIAGLWYAAEEEVLSGSGPSDYKLRQAWVDDGWQPHSIRVGDEWVSYAKLGPFSLLLGVVADVNYVSKMDTSNTNVEDSLSQTMGMLMHVVANNVLNKAYFQSMQQLMDAVQDPNAGRTFVDSWLLSFTPNILSQLNQDPNVREANTILEKLQRRLPIISESLGKQYDFYGREIMKPNHDIPFYGYMFKNSEIVRDPVGEEVFRLSESLDRSILDKPRYNLGITNTDFRDVYDKDETESVYAKYNRVLGETTDSQGRTLHEALKDLINSNEYQSAPHSIEGDITSPKVKMIKSIVTGFRGQAKGIMFNDSPAFMQQINDRGDRIQEIFK